MSRCYPYSSIRVSLRKGTGNGIGRSDDVHFVESRKLQSKNEKPKKEKGKGRDKEIKKGSKRNEEKPNDFSGGKLKKLKSDESYQGKKIKDSFTSFDRSEEGKTESLDNNSSLTEEHDEPMNVCSSYAPQSSDRKMVSATPSSGITVHKNILRIRLPSKKPCEVERLPPRKEQPVQPAVRVTESSNLSAALRVDSTTKDHQQQKCSTNHVNKELPSLPVPSKDKKDVPSSSKAPVVDKPHVSKKIQKADILYQSLMNSLSSVPLVLQPEIVEDDEDWLFGSKQQRQEPKLKSSDDITCRQSSSSNLWPQAQLLPEADIFALPFTVPF